MMHADGLCPQSATAGTVCAGTVLGAAQILDARQSPMQEVAILTSGKMRNFAERSGASYVRCTGPILLCKVPRASEPSCSPLHAARCKHWELGTGAYGPTRVLQEALHKLNALPMAQAAPPLPCVLPRAVRRHKRPLHPLASCPVALIVGPVWVGAPALPCSCTITPCNAW